MAQEMCVLPMRCKRCNSVFDLYYDLQNQEHQLKEGMEDGFGMRSLLSQSFCWRCRHDVVEELSEVRDTELELGGDELELTVEFE